MTITYEQKYFNVIDCGSSWNHGICYTSSNNDNRSVCCQLHTEETEALAELAELAVQLSAVQVMVAMVMTTALALMAVTVEMPTAVTHKIAMRSSAETKVKASKLD